jgi:hypothetical protein
MYLWWDVRCSSAVDQICKLPTATLIDQWRVMIRGSGGEVRDGAGKRVMECEMCTEKNKEGRGWERQWQ